VVFGTAGHIDHGKTTLVQALTGRDTDRLPEEKQRGISIDLGFAPLTLPSGRPAAFVDVPGHERFIRNMVAGVHGMDAVVLVVAATEGVMPQTVEHLAILDFLGVQRGMVVLTKADLVDDEWLALVESDTRAALAASFLANAPMVAVSAPTGLGLDAVRAVLDQLADQVPLRDTAGLLRLPIDRVFSVRGFGTVVTGTLTRGTISLDEPVQLMPLGIAARVRGLETHGRAITRASAGQRVAVNLAGVGRGQVLRGQVLTRPGQLQPATVGALKLTWLKDAPPLKHRGRVHTYVGTAEALARVYFWDRDELSAGQQAWAEVRWEEPVVIQRGDRVLFRTYSPVITAGGGVVAQVGVHHRRSETGLVQWLEQQLAGDPGTLALEQLDARDAPVALDELARDLGQEVADLAGWLGRHPEARSWPPRWVWSAASEHRVGERLAAVVRQYQEAHPLRPGWPRERQRVEFPGWEPRLFARLVASRDDLVLDGEWVRTTDFAPRLTPEESRLKDELMSRLEAAGLEPPDVEGLLTALAADTPEGRDVVQWLLSTGQLVRLEDNLLITASAFERAAAAVRTAIREAGPLGTAELRDRLGTSRKYAVPLLERLDAARVTRREGDVRVLVQA